MRAANGSARPAVFLDRDGTLIAEVGYLSDPAKVRLLPGSSEALRMLRAAGYALVVVTNQSGIARGFFTEEDYRRVASRIADLLGADGIALDAVYHCPHHPDFTGPCPCRKPGVELFQLATDALNLDTARSIFIGDRLQDVAPARHFGGSAILVETGYGEGEKERATSDVLVVADLLQAARVVIAERASTG